MTNDELTRDQRAEIIYNNGLKRVNNTSAPQLQKIPNGTRVRINREPNNIPGCWTGDGKDLICESEYNNKLGTIKYTYAHAYSDSSSDFVYQDEYELSCNEYCVYIDNYGEVSWFDLSELTIIEEAK